jgi:serine/threonine protein kinase
MVDAPLEWFGRFVILEPLGQGGMGRVDLALTTGGSVQQLVVLKRVRADQESCPEAAIALREEAKLAARLVHPNLVPAIGTETTATELAMVMEYVDGHPLVELTRAHQARGTRVPVRVALRILSDVLLGLEWAHSLRGDDGRPLHLVHRDVTPHNVFLTYRGQSKLLDFGLARVANAASRTATGCVKGKLGYMAPEQVRGEALDRRADVFAVGVILWELLAGRRLLQRANATWEYVSRAWHPLPSVREAAAVDAALAAIVDRALARAPEDRYASASELRLALDTYVATNEIEASPVEVARHLRSILGSDYDHRRERVLDRYVSVHKALRDATRESSRSDAPVASESKESHPSHRDHVSALAVAAGICAVGLGVAVSSPRATAIASSAASRAHREKHVVEPRFESLLVPGGMDERNNRTEAPTQPSDPRETRLHGDDGG